MRRSLLIFSLLLSAFSVARGQTQEDPKRKAMEYLRGSVANPNVDQAIYNANEAVKLQPDLAPGYFMLAQLYELKKDAPKADMNYTKALEATLITRGRFKAGNEQIEEAIDDFTQAFRLTQDAPRKPETIETSLAYLALYHRGLAYAEQDKYEEAFADWNDAIKRHPRFAEAFYSRGLLRNLRGDTDGAISDTLKALEIKNGNYKDASVSLGFFYQKQGKLNRAEEAYRNARKYNKDDPDLIHLLGVVLLAQSRVQDALPLLLQAARSEPEDATFLSDYASALIQMNQQPEAQQQLDRALSIDPQNPTVYERFGDLYKQMGRKEQARDSYQKALDYTDENDTAGREARQKKLQDLSGPEPQRPRTHNNP